MKSVIVAVSLALLFMFQPVLAYANLVPNPTFENTGTNGDPDGWFRGGYGQNTRGYSVQTCSVYTEDDLKKDSNDPNFVFRPACPPNAKHILVTNLSKYVNGDTKWYFSDVAIGSHKNFILSYQYQTYNTRSRVIARYAFPDGTHKYQFLADMQPFTTLGMGYVSWVKKTIEISVPDEAISLTVFFAVGEDGVCPMLCGTTDRGGSLSIANIVLKLKESSLESNLITNGDLEMDGKNDSPLAWKRGGWGSNIRVFKYPVVGADNINGFFFDKKAARVEILNYTNGDAKWYFDEVPVRGGKTYAFSDSYRASVPSEVGVYYTTPSGLRYQYIESLPAASNWTNYEHQIVAPADALSLTVFHTIFSVGYLEVDSISLIEL